MVTSKDMHADNPPCDTEQSASGTSVEETTVFRPRFNADGLIPAAARDAASGRLLMLAWMNEAALRLTLETGEAHYWSRSRQAMWRKGETSGNRQRVIDVLVDCDQDTLELVVEQSGPACHTGRASCFYRRVHLDKGTIRLAPLAP